MVGIAMSMGKLAKSMGTPKSEPSEQNTAVVFSKDGVAMRTWKL